VTLCAAAAVEFLREEAGNAGLVRELHETSARVDMSALALVIIVMLGIVVSGAFVGIFKASVINNDVNFMVHDVDLQSGTVAHRERISKYLTVVLRNKL
jgi:hypothetical protein